jgi:hypothetical protein
VSGFTTNPARAILVMARSCFVLYVCFNPVFECGVSFVPGFTWTTLTRRQNSESGPRLEIRPTENLDKNIYCEKQTQDCNVGFPTVRQFVFERQFDLNSLHIDTNTFDVIDLGLQDTLHEGAGARRSWTSALHD